MKGKQKIPEKRHELFSTFLTIKIFNFNRFGILNLECFNLNNYYYILNFIPNNKKLVFDQTFKFKVPEQVLSNGIELKFTYIKAFDLNINVFPNQTVNELNMFSIGFFYSNFKVISNGSKLCLTNSTQSPDIFQDVHTVGFGFSVRYSRKTCPLVFSNSKISFLQFFGLSNTFLKRNHLGFLSLNQSLNSGITSIYFNSYKIDLDSQLLSQDIFKESLYLKLYGSFNFIEKNSILKLENLVYIELFLDNLQDFLYKNYNLLGEFVTNRDDFARIIQIKISDDYQFPDEDFCLFKDFYISSSTVNFLKS
ncbi:unnamed protein product [Brachionus calyciflorus]|uniref:Uncharacterized protein n=1 Tax=Brachionus calyciflorus TaxID=104777 RepID=A0A814LU43_9BILA|nr:unnamed protein product [Brachionus calyciflorus]